MLSAGSQYQCSFMQKNAGYAYLILLILLYKNSIPSKVINDKHDNTELLSVKIFLDGKAITVIDVNNPHESAMVLKPPVSMCGGINACHPLSGLEGKRHRHKH